MRLNSLKPARGSKKPRKRLGRGHSAGQGKTGSKKYRESLEALGIDADSPPDIETLWPEKE